MRRGKLTSTDRTPDKELTQQQIKNNYITKLIQHKHAVCLNQEKLQEL